MVLAWRGDSFHDTKNDTTHNTAQADIQAYAGDNTDTQLPSAHRRRRQQVEQEREEVDRLRPRVQLQVESKLQRGRG